jgi:glycosyltransferase involved in cell wall biosynthesis
MSIDPSIKRKRRLLIFHPALAPYRIDQFNLLGELFEVSIVFLFDNVNNQNFDQASLTQRLTCHHEYLLRGPSRGDRCFRWGVLGCIRRHKPDIILSYEFSLTTQYLLFIKSLGLISQAVGSAIDDSPEICANIQSWPRRIARGAGMAQLDFIVVLSSQVADFYSGNFSFPRERIIVSPILQNPNTLRDSSELGLIARVHAEKYDLLGKKVVLFVGRLAPEKGLQMFLLSIAPVLAARDDVRLVLVGEGAERTRLETTVAELGLRGQVLMPGRFEGSQLHAWYSCASGFVLPSIYEPFGAVVNEALIFGLSVLCSQYAGSAAMAAKAGGLTFDPKNRADTVSAFERQLDGLSALGDTSPDRRPSLAEWNRGEMSSEWAKVGGGPVHEI